MDGNIARSRQPDAIRKAILWAFLPTLLIVLNAPSATYGQDVVVMTNIVETTIAPLNLGTHVDSVGTTTQITGGTRPGDGTNLFHSFDSFTLGTDHTAQFLNDMQLPTNNIFARVVGGASTIDGTLRTNNPLNAADPMNFGAANLWLVNPSGLLLGHNARVEVGGSVSMTTANYLRFEGTAALFDMLSTPVSLDQLSVAPVVAFGFSGSNPGAITVQGSQFSVTDGQNISLIGGKVVIQGDTLPDGTVQQPAQLSAPNGSIRLASTSSPGEFDVATLGSLPNVGSASFTSFGSVSLAAGSNIKVSGASTVLVKGGQLVLSINHATLSTSKNPAPPDSISLSPGSKIVTSNSGIGSGAEIQLIASNVRMDGASLLSETKGAGQGGNITVNGGTLGTLSLANIATITSQTIGLGRGGDVHVTADSLTIENASGILMTTQTGHGEGGDLWLNVTNLSLLGGLEFGPSLIQSANLNDGSGVGGDVTIQGITAGSVTGKVVLSGGSQILSSTQASGVGGQITITATSLDLSGSDIFDPGLVSNITSSTSGTGHGGDIVASVQQLSVLDGATISSHTSSGSGISSAGAGGKVTVQGLGKELEPKAGSVRLSGTNTGIFSDSTSGVPGEIKVNAGILTITNGAAISAGSPQATGPAGDVALTADSIVISAGGQIFSQSFAQDAGQVTIKADQLTLDNGSIVTNTSSEIGGRGGDVILNVGSASLTNGAKITSSSSGNGNAGNVTITASGAFTSQASTIATTADNAKGGDILIHAQSILLSNGSLISANSNAPFSETGGGNAGNITINSDSNILMQNSSVTTEASQASGGQVTFTAPDMIQLVNSRVSTSVGGLAGKSDGGNITIDPQFVVLQNSQILAQAVAGAGGAIDITATSAFIKDPLSIVSASSTLGISGTVNIQSPLQNVGGELTALTQEFSSAAALLAQQCAARAAGGTFSTFVVAAREGLPMEPGGSLASPSLTPELLGTSLSWRDRHSPIAAVTGAFQEYNARPIQLAKYGNACHQ